MYMSLVQKDDVLARQIPPRAEFSVLETACLFELSAIFDPPAHVRLL